VHVINDLRAHGAQICVCADDLREHFREFAVVRDGVRVVIVVQRAQQRRKRFSGDSIWRGRRRG